MDYLDTILKIVLGILALFGVADVTNKIVINYRKHYKILNIEGSSDDVVGRDKIVTINHNYGIQTVGQSENLLATREVASAVGEQVITETNFYVTGFDSLCALNDSPVDSSVDIKKIERFFQKVFDETGSQRNAASLMSGAFFAIASEKTNPEWQEHCASSLRELIHEWRGSAGAISNAFNLVKGKTEGFPSMKTNSDFYLRMNQYYDYLSGKCHHDHSEAVRKLRNIYGDQKIKIEADDIFKRTAAMFLSELFDVIKTVQI